MQLPSRSRTLSTSPAYTEVDSGLPFALTVLDLGQCLAIP